MPQLFALLIQSKTYEHNYPNYIVAHRHVFEAWIYNLLTGYAVNGPIYFLVES